MNHDYVIRAQYAYINLEVLQINLISVRILQGKCDQTIVREIERKGKSC